jgi:peroxiredoxin Q/BCP
MPEVHVGDPAPAFTAASASGEPFCLGDFLGKSAIVLFFYPRDGTPGCTAEACSFRDQYEAFQEAGAEVVGVSSDSPESHRRFAAQHHLPFHLVSDPGGALRRLYGVPKTLGLLPGRVTYVIDRLGIVRHVFSSQLQPARHIAEALRVLKETRTADGTGSDFA